MPDHPAQLATRTDPVTGHRYINVRETGVLFPRNWLNTVTGHRVDGAQAAHLIIDSAPAPRPAAGKQSGTSEPTRSATRSGTPLTPDRLAGLRHAVKVGEDIYNHNAAALLVDRDFHADRAGQSDQRADQALAALLDLARDIHALHITTDRRNPMKPRIAALHSRVATATGHLAGAPAAT
ncbi:hypothetical protein GS504_00985 [Rhodococcus hoagii]|nr:hypothetical protein [Prescottella equi]NKS72184.1 hypothetical protein [Prescottella equi]